MVSKDSELKSHKKQQKEEKRRKLWEKLQLSEIRETLTAEHQVEEYFYCHKDGDRVLRGRITLLLPDFAENGNLHHFLVGFDVYQDRDRLIVNEKKQLTQFYEQLTQSILENGNYIEALMDTAEIIQSVNLTHNLLEKTVFQSIGFKACQYFEKLSGYFIY